MTTPDARPYGRADAEVAAFAAEIGNLCERQAQDWRELDAARADLPAEDRGNEAKENERIERGHISALRAVFDRYFIAQLATARERFAPSGATSLSLPSKAWIEHYVRHDEACAVHHNIRRCNCGRAVLIEAVKPPLAAAQPRVEAPVTPEMPELSTLALQAVAQRLDDRAKTLGDDVGTLCRMDAAVIRGFIAQLAAAPARGVPDAEPLPTLEEIKKLRLALVAAEHWFEDHPDDPNGDAGCEIADAELTEAIAQLHAAASRSSAGAAPNFAQMRDDFLEQERVIHPHLPTVISVTEGTTHYLNAFVGFLTRRYNDYAARRSQGAV